MRRPEPPEPLPAPVIDSHAHLDITREGDGDLPLELGEALALARSVNVAEVVQVGCDIQSAPRALDLARQHDTVHAAVALHPTEAAQISADAGAGRLDDALSRIEGWAADPAAVAVGETGLDYYWTTDPAGREAQRESFRAHIEMARRLDRTLVIHDRDAHADVVRVLEATGPPPRVVFHCFSGDAAMARSCVRAGWYVSFAGPLTFRNAAALREAARAVADESGLSHVLVETDAPYLTPHPHRGTVNSSYLLPWTVRALAAATGIGLVETCVATREATMRAFALL